MANSNSSIKNFICYILFFGVVLLHVNATQENNIASTICPKTRNSSLCWTLLKPVGSMDALKLANYTLSLAYASAVEGARHAQQLEATKMTNPQLNKRYSDCSRRFNFVVVGLEAGKEALKTGGYIVLELETIAGKSQIGGCFENFKQPPPEPSSLPQKAKELGDICDIAAWVSSILAGDDY